MARTIHIGSEEHNEMLNRANVAELEKKKEKQTEKILTEALKPTSKTKN